MMKQSTKSWHHLETIMMRSQETLQLFDLLLLAVASRYIVVI